MSDETGETWTINEGTNATRNMNMNCMRMFRDYINPTTECYRSSIVRSPLVVRNFELKASTIQLVQKQCSIWGITE